MKLDDIDPLLSRARDHLAMAIRLRDTAARLQTLPGKQRLGQLAALYEQMSLHFLEESRAASAHRRAELPGEPAGELLGEPVREPLGEDTIEFELLEEDGPPH